MSFTAVVTYFSKQKEAWLSILMIGFIFPDVVEPPKVLWHVDDWAWTCQRELRMNFGSSVCKSDGVPA